MAVAANGVQEVVAVVVGEVPDQRRLQTLERGALQFQTTLVVLPLPSHPIRAIPIQSLITSLTSFSMMPRFALRKMSLIQSGVCPREEDGAPPPPSANGRRCLLPRAPFPLMTGVFFGESALLVVVELISSTDLLRGLTARGTEDCAGCWFLSLTFGGDG